jgi:c-di-GMP-related signal transduction protein
MLDRNMKEILKQLPITDKVKEALIDRKGELYVFIRLIESYEVGNWVAFRYAQKKSGVGDIKILDFYVQAIAWADMLD